MTAEDNFYNNNIIIVTSRFLLLNTTVRGEYQVFSAALICLNYSTVLIDNIRSLFVTKFYDFLYSIGVVIYV